MHERASLGPVSWLGVAVWAVGFGFEPVGDAQLQRFRADPGNAGRVFDRGLWRYTRHPNYFGDAAVWFGLWLLACSHWLGFHRFACVHDEHAGQAHRQAAAREAHGPLQGRRVRRLRAADQRFHPLATLAITGRRTAARG
jgi:hypothetical protein